MSITFYHISTKRVYYFYCFEIQEDMASKIRKYDIAPKKTPENHLSGSPRRGAKQICIKQPGILSRFTWLFLRLDMSWGTFWKQMQHMKTAPKWLARWKKLDLYSRVPVVSLPFIIPITIIHPSFIAAPRKGSVFNYSNKQGQHKSSKKKTRWWLNQPISNMLVKKGLIHLPQLSAWK